MTWIGGCGRPRKATAVQVTAVRTHDAIESHLTIVFAALSAAARPKTAPAWPAEISR
jgi:hypothetical protein